ncbi:MAG TPA: signal recognition particle-docking protein FtsY [Alphaproteobacteria bacterium]|nr:signal recognition particle-docking protein FtsY [Alphaproteobacteria bacterium]
MRLPWNRKKDGGEAATPAPPETEAPNAAAQPENRGWLARMREGMGRSASAITSGLTGIFTKAKLDPATLEELEDLLIQSDLGADAAMEICAALGKERLNKDISAAEVRGFLAQRIADILAPYAAPLVIDKSRKPFVILVTGVNGTGKTTTIGKLAHWLRSEGHKVMLAAGDTFRAAAIEQLQIWGERAGAPVIAGQQGADASGLVYEALSQARAAGADVLLIDTAGRLQNKTGLMEELRKINRVLAKQDETAPHAVLLVLDATTGQNVLSQIEVFRDMARVSGLIMTKLDGTARGGILVAAARKFGLPVHAIGVGEGLQDLRPFDAGQFARALTGAGEP